MSLIDVFMILIVPYNPNLLTRKTYESKLLPFTKAPMQNLSLMQKLPVSNYF